MLNKFKSTIFFHVIKLAPSSTQTEVNSGGRRSRDPPLPQQLLPNMSPFRIIQFLGINSFADSLSTKVFRRRHL